MGRSCRAGRSTNGKRWCQQISAVTRGSHQAAWTLVRGDDCQRIELNPRLKANNSYAVSDAAMAGLGIALRPCAVAGQALARARLQTILGDWTLPSVGVHAVFASARYLTPRVRALIDLAVQWFGAVPASLDSDASGNRGPAE